MDISLIIKGRLAELGLDQKDLAEAANVTESYVSQLLTRKKAPPAPGRTDLYDKMGAYLKLPAGELQKLAEIQRREELKKKVAELPGPLFGECRDLIIRKCDAGRRKEVRRIFEKEPLGELERLVTQKLLDVAQGVAREELRNEAWIHRLASLSGRTYEQMRVAILEFLDTDVLSISVEGCTMFLDPMIESWDIDLRTFAMEVMLNRRLTPVHVKRFEFAEQAPRNTAVTEPGLVQFLEDKSLSRDITEAEIEFLHRLQFAGRRPTPLYYYRELQNLRDPLHFTDAAPPTKRRRSA